MVYQRSIWTVLYLGMAASTMAQDKPFPESMVTLRAQPAVFFVRTTADIELTTPGSVTINVDSMKADLKGSNDNGQLKDRLWDLFSKDPDKYFVASKEQKTVVIPDMDVGSGSAFAISREGILLTNAHVVSSSSEEPLSPRTWGLLNQHVLRDAAEFQKILGPLTASEERVQKANRALLSFYAARSRFVAKFKSARIVLEYKVDNQKSISILRQQGVDALLSMKREEISVPVKVLDIGEELPGKDVAVLKAIFEPQEQARLMARSKQQNMPALDAMLANIQNDRMVCLRLGTASDVLPQARVQSLGYPGLAFNEHGMDPEAQFKVSSKHGQISQTKRMSTSGGWDIFEMTAASNPGDSGGPVLDMSGNVIGLNVGTASNSPESSVICLAIPISVAKEMLARLGIKPDPGPLSDRWEQGLRLFDEKKYEDALREIQAAINFQKGGVFLLNREASWYLRDMAGRCLQKLGKIPNGN